MIDAAVIRESRDAPARDAPVSLSVVILTHEEEVNLPHTLASIEALGAQVFIVDSSSSDRTVEIARAAGCTVVSHPFSTHAKQVNWALDRLPLRTDWVMRLDADERLTPELVAEVRAKLPGLPAAVTGLMIKRRVYFWGRWIRHGGYYPTWLLRIWRRGAARCEDRDMDEHMLIEQGRILRLDHDFIDENRKGLGFWVDKHNHYADREVAALSGTEAIASGDRAGGATARKRYLKNKVYARAPRYVRAFLYWLYRYFLRLGFLDGQAGFVFHFMQGFWYRLLVDAKLTERERNQPRK